MTPETDTIPAMNPPQPPTTPLTPDQLTTINNIAHHTPAGLTTPSTYRHHLRLLLTEHLRLTAELDTLTSQYATTKTQLSRLAGHILGTPDTAWLRNELDTALDEATRLRQKTRKLRRRLRAALADWETELQAARSVTDAVRDGVRIEIDRLIAGRDVERDAARAQRDRLFAEVEAMRRAGVASERRVAELVAEAQSGRGEVDELRALVGQLVGERDQLLSARDAARDRPGSVLAAVRAWYRWMPGDTHEPGVRRR